MGFQSVPNTAEITIVFQCNNEQMVNVCHAVYPFPYDTTALEDLAAAVDAAVGANILPIITQDATYLRTEVRGLTNENDLLVTNATSTGLGTKTSSALPNSVTLCVKKESAFTGRSARGRWYWIGMSEGDLATNENQVSTTDAAAILAAVEAIRVAINASGWAAVIVSRFAGGAQRAVGTTFLWIASALVNTFVDNQRRRLTR